MQEPLALLYKFAQPVEIKALQITQTTVNNPQAIKTCGATEIILFDKQGPQSTSRCLPAQHRTVDPSTHDDQVIVSPRGLLGISMDARHPYLCRSPAVFEGVRPRLDTAEFSLSQASRHASKTIKDHKT